MYLSKGIGMCQWLHHAYVLTKVRRASYSWGWKCERRHHEQLFPYKVIVWEFYLIIDLHLQVNKTEIRRSHERPCRNIRQFWQMRQYPKFLTRILIDYHHKNCLKCLEEIRKYVSKLIPQKNILYQGDPNHNGTFWQQIRLALITNRFHNRYCIIIHRKCWSCNLFLFTFGKSVIIRAILI